MSRDIEVVRALFALSPQDVISGRDLSELFGPDVEWIPPAESLVSVRRYRGYEGIRRLWTDMLATWEEDQPEPVRFVDLGGQVAVEMCIRARSARGIELETTWSGLVTFRGHKVIRIEVFTDRDEAERAAVSSTPPKGRLE